LPFAVTGREQLLAFEWHVDMHSPTVRTLRPAWPQPKTHLMHRAGHQPRPLLAADCWGLVNLEALLLNAAATRGCAGCATCCFLLQPVPLPVHELLLLLRRVLAVVAAGRRAAGPLAGHVVVQGLFHEVMCPAGVAQQRFLRRALSSTAQACDMIWAGTITSHWEQQTVQ
jgi:hypothetical protein